jgi:hypothetical protein
MVQTYTKTSCSTEASKDNQVTILCNQHITIGRYKLDKTGKVDFLEYTGIPNMFLRCTEERSRTSTEVSTD